MIESFPVSPCATDAIRWHNASLQLLDQRYLPLEQNWNTYTTVVGVVEAIKTMVVRGAPAIGITAAYGVVLAAREAFAVSGGKWLAAMENPLQALANSRPTAVNLFWALARMRHCMAQLLPNENPEPALLAEAVSIHQEDIAANKKMGRLGADVIREAAMHARYVMTHCNAGALATGGYGTALGVIRAAWQEQLIDGVFADETRPWLQGARLTAWELMQDAIPVTLNADVAAVTLLASGKISWVIVGADRIAANGDVANKIGTYALAVLARFHGVRFMVVAPASTFDLALRDGKQIPIEERDGNEVLTVQGRRLAPEGVQVFNPVFDVTPASLIDVIVTERGVIRQPSFEAVAAVMGEGPAGA